MSKAAAKAKKAVSSAARKPPFETAKLREGLKKFFDQDYVDGDTPILRDKDGSAIRLGAVKWGAYAFYDYDNEPIYVGQTKESLSQRVSRHLTNQRTDAVAMAVLDPFEVRYIEVWPLPQFQQSNSRKAPEEYKLATATLNALERAVFDKVVAESNFNAVLNEKEPPVVGKVELPKCWRGEIVLEEVLKVREHDDTRIARRALTISRLAQVISERELKKGGLRKTLLTQARRLQALAEKRYIATGGQPEVREPDEDEAQELEE